MEGEVLDFADAKPARLLSASLPDSGDPEANLISCIFVDAEDVFTKCELVGITPSTLQNEQYGCVFGAAWKLWNDGKTPEPAILTHVLQQNPRLTDITNIPLWLLYLEKLQPTTAHVATWVDAVREARTRRRMQALVRSAALQIESGAQPKDFLHALDAELRAIVEEVEDTDGLGAIIAKRKFKFGSPIPEPKPRFYINGHAVSTPGNITALLAQAKAGKSAFVGTLIAAALAAEVGATNRDTFGVSAIQPGRAKLIHFDTEQSPHDHDQLVRRSLRRAGVETTPEWLWSYGCAGLNAHQLRRALRKVIKQARKAGGVFAVILDGVADLVDDVNDQKEVNPFVAELHQLAIENECPIVCIIHENPGQDTGKSRGHLGSQLERKAESNIRLKKVDEVTVVFSDKMRRAPILEKNGPRFKWDDEQGMHASCASADEEDSKPSGKKRGRERVLPWSLAKSIIEPLLAGGRRQKWVVLHKACSDYRQASEGEKVSKGAFQEMIDEAMDLGLLVKMPPPDGRYYMPTPAA